MSAKPSPNDERKPGQPFHYKPSALLEPEDGLIERMLQLGMLQVTHPEAAAVLGVSKNTLERFWEAHPIFKEAFQAGKELDKVRLRRTLRMHAQLDAGTARFLAKNQLGLSDDPSKAKLDEQTAKTLKGMTRQEADGRILELKAKLIGEQRIVSRETYTTQEGEDGHLVQSVVPEAEMDRAGLSGNAASGDGEPVRRSWADQKGSQAAKSAGSPSEGEKAQGSLFTGRSARLTDSKEAQRALEAAAAELVRLEKGDERAVGQAAGEPSVAGDVRDRQDNSGGHRAGGRGGRAPQGRALSGGEGVPSEPSAVAKLEARLAELEASTVRKNPRKDGAPHTDRTKAPMDAGANTRQEVKLGHAPSRLPGRLGSR